MGARWKLREAMASRGLYHTADLHPLLAERGLILSKEQVWRLVTQEPVRLQIDTLAALCDILDCKLDTLIEFYEVKTQLPRRKAVNDTERKQLSAQITPIAARIAKPRPNRKK